MRSARSLLGYWLAAAWLSLAGAATASPPVDDSTRNAARNLAEQGRDAFDRGNFERSRELFHRAYALVAAPTLALYEARSLSKLGRLVEAEEAYLRAIRTPLDADSPEAFRKAVRDAEAEEVELEPRLPKVTIVIHGVGADSPALTVSIDGAPLKAALLGVEMPINPGSHSLEARVAGGEPARLDFIVSERERKSVELRVAPPPAPEPVAPTPVLGPSAPGPSAPARSSWQRPVAYAAGGLGAVGLATGVVAGLMASGRHAKLDEQCPDRLCVEGSAGADSLRSFHTLRTVSTVGYVVGAVALAAGVTLFVLAPSEPREQTGSVAIWMNIGHVGVRGAF